MDAHNLLQQARKAPFPIEDPGNGFSIEFRKNWQYCSLAAGSATSGAETRKMLAPNGPGRICMIGCSYYGNGNIVVTVYDNVTPTPNATGAITFTNTSQWVRMVSVETTAGVYVWFTTDCSGCTTTVPAATTNSTATAVTYAGASTANSLQFPTNLAAGLYIQDSASVKFATLDSTTGTPVFNIDVPLNLDNATTPYLTTAAGKTNTGYLEVLGKTSGGVKLTTADATGNVLTLSAAAVAVASRTLTLPDPGGADSFVYLALAQEMTGKTLTAPVIKTGLTASGSAANTFAGSTGTFVTSSGANTLSGDTTVAAAKNFSAATGAGAFDWSAATGIFKTSTGVNTFGGNTAHKCGASVTAAGANQGAATALNEGDQILVTGVTGQTGYGVVFPSASYAGKRVIVQNITAFACKIYPFSTEDIGAGASTAITLAASTSLLLVWSAAGVGRAWTIGTQVTS